MYANEPPEAPASVTLAGCELLLTTSTFLPAVPAFSTKAWAKTPVVEFSCAPPPELHVASTTRRLTVPSQLRVSGGRAEGWGGGQMRYG